jgi:hypothetical protein
VSLILAGGEHQHISSLTGGEVMFNEAGLVNCERGGHARLAAAPAHNAP